MYRSGECLREITMLISNQACQYVHQIRHVHQSIQSDMSVCLSIKSVMFLSPSNQACPSVHQIRHVRLSIRLGMSISLLVYCCCCYRQKPTEAAPEVDKEEEEQEEGDRKMGVERGMMQLCGGAAIDRLLLDRLARRGMKRRAKHPRRPHHIEGRRTTGRDRLDACNSPNWHNGRIAAGRGLNDVGEGGRVLTG